MKASRDTHNCDALPVPSYRASDSGARTFSDVALVRIEAGARHALSLTVALNCSSGYSALAEQVRTCAVCCLLERLHPSVAPAVSSGWLQWHERAACAAAAPRCPTLAQH